MELLFALACAVAFWWVAFHIAMGIVTAIKDFFSGLFGGGGSSSTRSSYTSSSSYSGTSYYYKPEKESPYTRDWASVSRKYKEARGWRCEECYVNLSRKQHRRLLHVHHRDNDPKNNYSWNLVALCVICHSEQPGAGHKRLAGAITSDGRRREVEWLR